MSHENRTRSPAKSAATMGDARTAVVEGVQLAHRVSGAGVPVILIHAAGLADFFAPLYSWDSDRRPGTTVPRTAAPSGPPPGPRGRPLLGWRDRPRTGPPVAPVRGDAVGAGAVASSPCLGDAGRHRRPAGVRGLSRRREVDRHRHLPRRGLRTGPPVRGRPAPTHRCPKACSRGRRHPVHRRSTLGRPVGLRSADVVRAQDAGDECPR